jgi:hypothetical protein
MAKIFHNVFKPFNATSIAKSTTDSTTCEWLDVSGWVDKKIAWEADSSGSIDIDIDALVSSKSAYELNNEATVDTEDYETINIVTAHTSAVYFSKDSNDVTELETPWRAVKITVDNDDASSAVSLTLWVEGQS